VGQVGEDIEAGQGLLRAGRVLRPQDVGVLASVGTGGPPAGTRIVDSNSVMLEGLVGRDGGVAVRDAIVPDLMPAGEPRQPPGFHVEVRSRGRRRSGGG
jgi:molybdopterin molybdotransferase